MILKGRLFEYTVPSMASFLFQLVDELAC